MSPGGVKGHLRRFDHDRRGLGRLFNLCFLELLAVEISSQMLTFTNFSLQGIHSYIEGVRVEPVLDLMFAFWAMRKHERGLLLACVEAWRKGTLDVGILQALKKRVDKSYKLYCTKNNL